MALFDFIPDNFNQDVNEYKVYNVDNEFNPDSDGWDGNIDGFKNNHGIDEEKEEKAKVFQKKSNENVNEDEVDNKSDDDWDSFIEGLKNGPTSMLFDEIEEEKEEKDDEYQASTSTGRRNGDGVPTERQKVPYLLSDLCKPKNPKTSKRMEKPFKGIAYC